MEEKHGVDRSAIGAMCFAGGTAVILAVTHLLWEDVGPHAPIFWICILLPALPTAVFGTVAAPHLRWELRRLVPVGVGLTLLSTVSAKLIVPLTVIFAVSIVSPGSASTFNSFLWENIQKGIVNGGLMSPVGIGTAVLVKWLSDRWGANRPASPS